MSPFFRKDTTAMKRPQQRLPSIQEAHPSRDLAVALSKALGAVIFPVGRDKKPAIRKWQELTLEDATSPRILSMYGPKYPSIGVLLGKPSGNLCSIDIDSDELLETFLKGNPKLASSLRSRAHRGGNIWVRIRGEYPRLSKLQFHGEPCGEWRADGGYTIIAGIHP